MGEATPVGAEPEVGAVLGGRYRLVRRLGQGGMGTVFEAEQIDLGRRVAIKVLAPDLGRDPSILRRFQREALASAQLQHPNIAQTTAFVTGAGPPFLVMELVHGEPLRDVLSRERFDAQRAARLGVQILDALELAHTRGIVHRDLKPSNLMVQTTVGMTEFFKLLDFGIAKVVDEDRATQLTRTGSVVGTPGFMAPEQARDGTIDGRTDLYSLGVVLYRAVSGRLPFNGTSETALLLAIVSDPPLPLARAVPDIDRRFAAIVDRAIRKPPEERYPDARSMREALTPIASGEPDRSFEQDATMHATPAEAATKGRRKRAPAPAEPASPAAPLPETRSHDAVPSLSSAPIVRADETPAPRASKLWPVVGIVCAIVGILTGIAVAAMTR